MRKIIAGFMAQYYTLYSNDSIDMASLFDSGEYDIVELPTEESNTGSQV